MNASLRRNLLRYGVSLAVTALCLLLRWPLWSLMGDIAPYVQNYPAVFVSAWYGGLGPGLLATILSALATTYFLLTPHGSIEINDPAHLLSLGMFLLVGVIISVLNESLHQSRRGLEARIEERTADLTIANEILQEEIRERKRIEEALKQSAAEISDLYHHAPCGYHSLDAAGIFLQINDTELSWLGYDREEVIGKLAFRDMLTETSRQRFDSNFERLKETGRVRDLEYDVRRKDGSAFPVLMSADAVEDEAGNFQYSRSTMYNLTERKQVEGLAEANRYKDQFLAVLGHELRNPLGAMTNALFLLRQRSLRNPELLRDCDLMDRQLRHMIRLVDDLRDASRINQGKLQIETARLDLRSVLRQSVEATRPLLQERNHDLDLRLPPEPCWVEGDGERLAQVFTNLLNNAAKYTDPGGQLSLLAEKNGSHVTVKVRDTGIGIPAEALPRIFHLYAQADSALARSQGGLGIGLSLVKGLVEQHGGHVSVRSEGPGRGSEFQVILPLAQPETKEGNE